MLISLALFTASISPQAGAPEPGYDLPARFVADRVYVEPIAADGKALYFYTDTGGGLFITEGAARHLDLKAVASTQGGNAESPQQVLLPVFKSGKGIPVPQDGKIAVMPQKQVSAANFSGDGMLGEAWFGGHVWTWNYPAKKFRVEGSDWKPDPSATRIALGFPLEKGARGNNFARMAITVEGESIDMLLDTGATTTLTPAALKTCADRLPAERATSFIVAAQFQAWRKAHPAWRVIEQGEAHTNAAMIEVPVVEIAGTAVGPVWFTSRADSNFHDYMSGMMDQRVEGAVGGNALGHFVMTIDYPSAAAYFKCTRDCAAKPRSAP